MKTRVLGALCALVLLSCEKMNPREAVGASVDALAGESDKKSAEAPAPVVAAAPPAPPAKALAMHAAGDLKVDADSDGILDARDGPAGGGGKERKKSPRPMPKGNAKEDQDGDTQEGSIAAAPTRSWFPESFLFEPVVVTNSQGEASLNIPVPDRLTSWRILALAHSRQGAQAGATTSFLGTLPAYVDPVVPAFLIAGDQVRLPIQLVNTTSSAISLPLKTDAVGGTLTGANANEVVPAGGSRVDYAELKTQKPGVVSLHAVFGNADAISRNIPVYSSGRPVSELRGGTLAAPRTIEIQGATDLEPESTRVRLQVFPGALGLLRSELTAASSRGGVAADGYALLLAGRAPQLLTALGDKPDPEALRSLGIVAAQRALRDARAPDVPTAATLGEAALAHPENPVLVRLGDRLVAQLAQSQRADGTFEGGSGWTLQRLLVTTAQCVQTVRADQHDDRAKQRAAAVTLKAQGAFERNLERIGDGYTAAAVLASGALPESLKPKLRAKVRDAVKTRQDGSRVLAVGSHVLRPDGQVPSEMEATALAVLALDGDPEAPWRVDLGSALLGNYSPGSGWGDGETNLVALRAVLALFKDPLPSSVAVTLSMDGKPVAQGEMKGDALRDVMALDANVGDAAGKHSWTVSSTPPVPGLGFALALTGYVPWKPESMNQGLELAIKQPAEGRVGEPLEVELTAAAPANVPVQIRHSLAAGVEADTQSLAALVTAGTIAGFHTEPGAIVIDVAGRPANTPLHASYRVIPTLAGTLHAPASTIEASSRGASYHLPPVAWAVK